MFAVCQQYIPRPSARPPSLDPCRVANTIRACQAPISLPSRLPSLLCSMFADFIPAVAARSFARNLLSRIGRLEREGKAKVPVGPSFFLFSKATDATVIDNSNLAPQQLEKSPRPAGQHRRSALRQIFFAARRPRFFLLVT